MPYVYGDSNWKDKLTSFDGKAITYDAIGNPLTYDGWTFTWKAGRMLHSMVKTGTTVQFTYDHNGMRTKKVVNGVATEYTLNGKNIVHLKKGTDEMHFFYDAQGKPGMVRFNGTDYFYVYDLQGDVVALVDAAGTKVVEYVYDAWGSILSTSGAQATTLGYLNPFRYRGYVYDEESSLYYILSRFYSPFWKRFLNEDTMEDLFGINSEDNLFRYCFNNPIMYSDDGGFKGFYIDLGQGWNARIDPEIPQVNDRHIHIWNDRESYSQTDKGYIHDNKGGNPPSWIQKKLKKLGKWVWRDNNKTPPPNKGNKTPSPKLTPYPNPTPVPFTQKPDNEYIDNKKYNEFENLSAWRMVGTAIIIIATYALDYFCPGAGVILNSIGG